MRLSWWLTPTLLATLCLSGYAVWEHKWTHNLRTDMAYVEADLLYIKAQQSGIVQQRFVDDLSPVDAGQLLLQLRGQQAEAVERFRWPQLTTFNWALDHFDTLAAKHAGPALWITEADGSEQRFTFADMSARSNRVANWLRGLGVKRGGCAAAHGDFLQLRHGRLVSAFAEKAGRGAAMPFVRMIEKGKQLIAGQGREREFVLEFHPLPPVGS